MEKSIKIKDAVLAVKGWFVEREGRWQLIFDGAISINGVGEDDESNDYIDILHFILYSPYVDVIVTLRVDSSPKWRRRDGTRIKGVLEGGKVVLDKHRGRQGSGVFGQPWAHALIQRDQEDHEGDGK